MTCASFKGGGSIETLKIVEDVHEVDWLLIEGTWNLGNTEPMKARAHENISLEALS